MRIGTIARVSLYLALTTTVAFIALFFHLDARLAQGSTTALAVEGPITLTLAVANAALWWTTLRAHSLRRQRAARRRGQARCDRRTDIEITRMEAA